MRRPAAATLPANLSFEHQRAQTRPDRQGLANLPRANPSKDGDAKQPV